MHHNSILIKIQLDATVWRLIYFTAKSLYMFRVSPHYTKNSRICRTIVLFILNLDKSKEMYIVFYYNKYYSTITDRSIVINLVEE